MIEIDWVAHFIWKRPELTKQLGLGACSKFQFPSSFCVVNDFETVQVFLEPEKNKVQPQPVF